MYIKCGTEIRCDCVLPVALVVTSFVTLSVLYTLCVSGFSLMYYWKEPMSDFFFNYVRF